MKSLLLFTILFSLLSVTCFAQADGQDALRESGIVEAAEFIATSAAITDLDIAAETLDEITKYRNSSVGNVGCPDVLAHLRGISEQTKRSIDLGINGKQLESGNILSLSESFITLKEKFKDEEKVILKDLESHLNQITNNLTHGLTGNLGAVQRLCSGQPENIRLSLLSSFTKKSINKASVGKLISSFASNCGFSRDQISISGVKTSVTEAVVANVLGSDGKNYTIDAFDLLPVGSAKVKEVLGNGQASVELFKIENGKISTPDVRTIGELAANEAISLNLDSINKKFQNASFSIDGSPFSRSSSISANAELGGISAKAVYSEKDGPTVELNTSKEKGKLKVNASTSFNGQELKAVDISAQYSSENFIAVAQVRKRQDIKPSELRVSDDQFYLDPNIGNSFEGRAEIGFQLGDADARGSVEKSPLGTTAKLGFSGPILDQYSSEISVFHTKIKSPNELGSHKEMGVRLENKKTGLSFVGSRKSGGFFGGVSVGRKF